MARYMAERIPNATLVELNSADHLIWFSDALDVMTDEIQDFLTENLPNRETSRVLATVLFIDRIHRRRGAGQGHRTAGTAGRRRARSASSSIGSGEAPCGTPRTECWRPSTDLLARFAARRPSSAISAPRGSMFGPACTAASARCGGDQFGGVAVQIARGVADLARPGEVLVSQTVRDLVFGSAITFSGPGSQTPQGVPGEWRVYTVTST